MPPPIERRPGVADLGAPRLVAIVPDLLRSVVYLESAPRGAFETDEGGHAVLDQRNETFVPHVLAITAGTTVDFPNSDHIYHNVFSLSKTERFDLGRYAKGKSKSVRFDQPGIVRVFCEIHSHMNAFILVFAHPYFAMTDSDGRYRIDNVPPGNYSVIAWNEGVAVRGRAGHRAGRRRGGTGFHAAMTILSSLRGRIFLTSALLAVLAIGVAIYVVNVRVTRQAELTLQREIVATGALVDQLRTTRGQTFTTMARVFADSSLLKAAVDTNDPPTVQDIAGGYQAQLNSNLLLVTNKTGGILATRRLAAQRPRSSPASRRSARRSADAKASACCRSPTACSSS